MRMRSVATHVILILLLAATGISAQPPAFPSAEGAGKYTIGGRGGKVLYVTSLEDTEQSGTLRWAVKQKGVRTIVFNVSGIIRLKSPLKINNGDLTIAGQTAPGDGICIRDHETIISADNVIIRFLRFRLGDVMNEPVDAFSGKGCRNILIDHCSMSWSIDEVSSFYDNENFTMQWCIIAESLRNSVHGKGRHGYGGIWGGKNASFHHNLLVHNDSRNPRFCGSRYSNRPDLESVDFRNNVIYNWGANNVYGAEGGNYNIIHNYYKPGPATSPGAKKRILNPDADNGANRQPAGTFGRFYLCGNYLEGNEKVTQDNVAGVEMGSTFAEYAPGTTLNDIISDTEFSFLPVTTHPAQMAYEKVLEYAGSSLVRDTLDKRYVADVRAGSFTLEGSNGSSNGLIDSQQDVGGWPEYRTYNVPPDSDHDGIPDGWLEARYPGKKASDTDAEGYTYLELYLNSLVAHLMGGENKVSLNGNTKHIVVDWQGNGDFKTIQEAIHSVRAFDPDGTTVILIKEGIYREKIVIPDYICHIKLLGEGVGKTIITYNDHAKIDDMGTFRTYTLQIRGNDIVLENLTVENAAEPVAQAVVLHTEGDRIIIRNCRLQGNQDTVYTGGEGCRVYFQDCYIEGTTDFIFGPATCWFEKCTLHCKRNSYITAASTPRDVPFGYVFNRCTVTLQEDVTSVYLGRPWRPYAMTVFMHCDLPEGIHPTGWDNWRNPENEKTARYSEYRNKGAGSATGGRVGWGRILSEKEAEQITMEIVFERNDRWMPVI